jgi:drug/metabolite transporter (DMT)-like permease
LLAAVALWVIAVFTKAPKLERIHIAPTVAVGICMHALYLGGVFFAVSQGLPSGVSALIAGLHPVLTSFVGNWVLKEKLRPLQWCGIGLGVLGVVAVLIDRRNAHSTGITALAITAMIISVIGMASGTDPPSECYIRPSRGLGRAWMCHGAWLNSRSPTADTIGYAAIAKRHERRFCST